MNRPKWILAIILIFITVGGIFSIINQKNTNEPAFNSFEDKRTIIKAGEEEIFEAFGENFTINEHEEIIYVDMDMIVDNFDTNISFDEEDKTLTITTLDKVIRFYGHEDIVKVNQRETKNINPMILIEDRFFIPINELEDYLKISSSYVEETNILILKNQYSDETIGSISRDNVKLFQDKSIFSTMKDTLYSNEPITILEEDNEWTSVMTEKGLMGYVKTDHITGKKTIAKLPKEQRNSPIWKPEEGKVILAWEHVHSRNPDTSKIGNLQGVNVVSPTWLSLANSSGKLNSNISKDYIKWAKDRGYKIWILITNSFDPDLTHEFLKDSLARERVIDELLKIVKENELDGINIDFENVYLKSKDDLVQFVRELTPVFHGENLVVSIDVTVKGGSENWSLFYDRAALGEVVDYVALMTYDEHWAASPRSGSVASIPWVETGVKGLLEDVPKEKLLMGIPFYTRLWTETPSKKAANTMDVKSRALTMEGVNNILEGKDVVKVWDENAGQDYIVYIEDGSINKIWVEDEKSIRLKTELANKYDLAGVAIWRRGFETQNIWGVIDDTLN